MAIRDKLKRLRKAMRDQLDGFEQADGTTFYFDPQEALWVTFSYFTASMHADGKREPRPEPPEILKAVARAKDRRRALELVMQGSSFLSVDGEALVERGEFVPRPLAAGRTEDGPIPDLSE